MRDSDGWIRPEKESQRQHVVIVRTGDEDSLSEPVNFASIRTHALPLAREDIPEADNGVFAIRVSIATAVKFICHLIRREESVFFSSREHSALDNSRGAGNWDQYTRMQSGIYTTQVAEAWADAEIKKAETDGVNNVLSVKYAVIDAHRVRRGEHLPETQPYRIVHKW